MAPAPRRHQMFYYSDGTHVFLAENLLFKVHRSILSEKSTTFREMLTGHSDIGAFECDGMNDERPIVTEVTADDFELFLSVCYNKWRPDVGKMQDEVLLKILDLSQKYQSNAARSYALQQLKSRHCDICPSNLITIALKYQIKDTFRYGFSKLIPSRLNDLDRNILTFPVWITLAMTKERLDIHRRIVACEPPPMTHSKRCRDRRACDNDWRQVWWNGMGRFLLDGRNPLSYTDAMQQFQEFDYGDVCPDCWRQMLDFCKQGKAFAHEPALIDRTARELADRLIVDPVFDDDEFVDI